MIQPSRSGLSRNYRFLALLGGTAVSKLGDHLYFLALPWLAYEITHSAALMGSLYAVEMLPHFLFSGVAGVAADRLNRWRLMVWADGLRSLLVLVLPALYSLGHLQVWHFFVAAFLLSTLTVLFDVSYYAVFPQVVGRDHLTSANSQMWTVLNTAELVGPALGGLLIARFGAHSLLYWDGLSFCLSLIVLLTIAPRTVDVRGLGRATDWWADLKEGFSILFRTPLIRQLSALAAVINLAWGMASAVLVFYLRSTLQLDATLAGAIYSFAGAGSIGGAMAVPFLTRWISRGRLIPALLFVSVLGVLAMGLSGHWAVVGFGFALWSACVVTTNVITTAIRQQAVVDTVLGRVMSVHRMVAFSGIPVGSGLAAALVPRLGAQGVILVAAVILCVTVAVGTMQPLRALDRATEVA